MLLSYEKQLKELGKLIEKLTACEICCETKVLEDEDGGEALREAGAIGQESLYLPDNAAPEGTLYLTDSAEIMKRLADAGVPALAYLNSENSGEDFSVARYACEEAGELEPEYLERIYRRFHGLPWNILETSRCLLRESVEEDAEAFVRIYEDAAVTRYMESLQESRVGERGYIKEYMENMYSYYEFGIWTVILKETGEIIGRAGLSVREGCELPELGYVIGVPWQRKGLAEEVCRGILKYAEEELGFDRLQVLIHRKNEISVHLAEKLGFKKQGQSGDCDKDYIIFVRSKQ